MKKLLKIILIILPGFLCLVLAAVGGFNAYLRISLSEFYKSAKTECGIPGISDGYIPQGLFCSENDGEFISCGYMNDGSASRIYIFGENGEKYACLKNADGSDNTSHAGGLCLWKNYVLMTDGDKISVYDWQDVKSAADKSGAVKPKSSFEVGFDAAFCYVDGDTFYVGEFYREQNYPTDSTHHLTTPAGDLHHAVISVYDINEIALNGFEDALPVSAYSVTDLAQGMCVTDSGRICISASYAAAASHILVYDAPSGKTDKEIEINGKSVPLYFLDSAAQCDDISLFPMSEELANKDGRVYIINESASAKYKFGKFTGGGKIYSVEIE